MVSAGTIDKETATAAAAALIACATTTAIWTCRSAMAQHSKHNKSWHGDACTGVCFLETDAFGTCPPRAPGPVRAAPTALGLYHRSMHGHFPQDPRVAGALRRSHLHTSESFGCRSCCANCACKCCKLSLWCIITPLTTLSTRPALSCPAHSCTPARI